MRQRSGFGLVEVLVVLAIAGVLFAVVPLVLPRDGLAVNQAADGLVADVQLARFEALSRAAYIRLAMEPAANRYRLLEVEWNGAGWDVLRVIKEVPLADRRTARVTLTADASNDLIYDPRGNPIGLGVQAVRFDTPSGRTATVTISQQGRATR